MQKDTYIVILGAGESGVGAALLAQSKGYAVFVSDSKTISESFRVKLEGAAIDFEQNGHSWDRIRGADLVVKSPGIPDHIALIQELKILGIPVISEIEWGFRFVNAFQVIAITGTNGKTTTATLTHHIISSEFPQTLLVGNIGDSFAAAVSEDSSRPFVIEVSSFQLDGIEHFAPHIAIITNITPDHLDRYQYQMELYIQSKMRIVANQTEQDYLIYDADDPILVAAIDNSKDRIKSRLIPFSTEKLVDQGACLKDGHLVIHIDNQTFTMDTSLIPIPGKHNLKNTMASATAALLKSVRKEAIRQSIEGFTGVPHRMEVFEEFSGVRFINDSKATNVNASYFALESVKRPVIWIAGGVDKGNDYKSLMPLVREKVKAILCIGVDNQKLVETFGRVVPDIVELESLEDAVAHAMRYAEHGDTVLLSPACASFDRFANYEDRGNQFKRIVKSLD